MGCFSPGILFSAGNDTILVPNFDNCLNFEAPTRGMCRFVCVALATAPNRPDQFQDHGADSAFPVNDK